MEVFYHRSPRRNIGDDLNEEIWGRLLPDLAGIATADWLVGVGTIIDARLNPVAGSKIVVGSGYRPGRSGSGMQATGTRVAAVRGTGTAEALGLHRDLAICDPGFLIARLWPFNRLPAPKTGFIPHIYSEDRSSIATTAADAGLRVISPSLATAEFLRLLAGCDRVFCESLHGAIFADALRIPWARVKVCSHHYEGQGVADFKWADAFSVLGASTRPVNRLTLFPARRSWSAASHLLRTAQSAIEGKLVSEMLRLGEDHSTFGLSEADRLRGQVERLVETIHALRDPAAVARFPSISTAAGRSWRSRRVPGARTARQMRVMAFPKSGENAYLRLFADALESGGARVDDFSYSRAFLHRYDVLHIHWPEIHLRARSAARALFKHARFALLCGYLRMRGTRIVWMVHNIASHERSGALSERLFRSCFPRYCTHVIALTGSGLGAVRREYPPLLRKPGAIIPHGHYRSVYPQAPSRTQCRERLGLRQGRFTFLFFGNIRRYKNVPLLIETFSKLADSDIQLVVAGMANNGMEAGDIEAAAAGDERIHLHLRFIPDEEVPVFFGAADLVVLPFDSVLNSGSVLLALSFNRMVLAPRLGALPEIQDAVGSTWLHLYGGVLDPAQLETTRRKAAAVPEDVGADLSGFDWPAIGTALLDFYRAPRAGSAAAGNP